jgi:hypothetical protein
MGTKDLAIAKDNVKSFAIKRTVGGEQGGIRVICRYAREGNAHLLSEEGDVPELNNSLSAYIGTRPPPSKHDIMTTQLARKRNSSYPRRRVASQGSQGEATRGHTEVKDAVRRVVRAVDGERRGRFVDFEADGAHQTEEPLLCLVVGFVGLVSTFFEKFVSLFVVPALISWLGAGLERIGRQVK